MSQAYVVDASVGIKLFLVEPLAEVAERLFDQLAVSPLVPLYVPDLFYVECANILWKYVRRFGYPAENARQDVADLRALNLQVAATADVLETAFNLALQFEITTYDASYVALAQQLGLPLVTADTTLVRKLVRSGLDVRSLAEL
jgi:predicted nucleic acid-binding protein